MSNFNNFQIFFQLFHDAGGHCIHNVHFNPRHSGFEFVQHFDMMNIAYHSSIMQPSNPIGYIPMKQSKFAYEPDGVFFHLMEDSTKAYYVQLKSVTTPIHPMTINSWSENYLGMCDTLSIGFCNHTDFINYEIGSEHSWFQKVDYSSINDNNIKVTSDLRSIINTIMDRQVDIQRDYYLDWCSIKDDFTRYE